MLKKISQSVEADSSLDSKKEEITAGVKFLISTSSCAYLLTQLLKYLINGFVRTSRSKYVYSNIIISQSIMTLSWSDITPTTRATWATITDFSLHVVVSPRRVERETIGHLVSHENHVRKCLKHCMYICLSEVGEAFSYTWP